MARGSIVKRPSGNYAIVYYVDGKQKWKVIGPKKKDAERALTKIMGAVHDGSYREPKEILFRDLCDKWLKTRAKARQSTVEFYRRAVKLRLEPQFGHLSVRNIDREMIDLYVAELSAPESGYAPQTVANCIQVLKSIFKAAEEWDYVSKDPARAVKKPRVPKLELDFYKPDEIARLLEAADRRHYPMILTLAYTGVRRSEFLGLSWSDIDFTTNELHVRYQASGSRLVELKSAHSRRRIPMEKVLADALREHQTRQLVDGPDNPMGLCFPSEAGTPMNPGNFLRRIFWPTIARAGLRRLPPHSLRHSYATILLANNRISLPEVSQRLGHQDASITAKVYCHHLRSESGQPDVMTQAIRAAKNERVTA